MARRRLFHLSFLVVVAVFVVMWAILADSHATVHDHMSHQERLHEERTRRQAAAKVKLRASGGECGACAVGSGGSGGESSNREFEIEFRAPGPLGIQFGPELKVLGFYLLPGGKQGVAERSGLLRIGDRLMYVNGENVSELSLQEAFQVLDEVGAASAAAAEKKRADMVAAVRVFTFERGEGTDEHRELSEGAMKHKAGALDHLDVHAPSPWGQVDTVGGIQREDVVLPVLVSEKIGSRPVTCPRVHVTFVKPDDGCADHLSSSAKLLNGSIAVVRRGGCSFHAKAAVLMNYNASAVIVINNEDTVFTMDVDALLDNEKFDIPVAMVSRADGDNLRAMQRGSVNGRLEARLVASKECIERDEEETMRTRLTPEQHKKEARVYILRNTPKVDETLQVRHRLYGMLAPAGRVRVLQGISRENFVRLNNDALTQAERETTLAFDFLSASFSGPLPVGSPLNGGNDAVAVLPASRWESFQSGNSLVRHLISMQAARSGLKIVFLASAGTKLRRIEAQLPSALMVAVVVVSKEAGAALSQALSHGNEQTIAVEPRHHVKHRWDELEKLLAAKDQWLHDKKLKQRVIGGFYKSMHSNGKEAHVSKCWTRHFEATIKRVEL